MNLDDFCVESEPVERETASRPGARSASESERSTSPLTAACVDYVDLEGIVEVSDDPSTGDTEYGPEPVAAEEIDGVECQYSSCENEADWLVEVEGWEGFVCCQRCSVKNRIYAKENELIKTNVSEQARQSVDADNKREGSR